METNESGTRNNGQRRAKTGAEEVALTVGQRVDHINDSAHEAWSRTSDAVKDLKDALDIDRRVDQHPYAMVAAAVGIGYVLGGGIFSPLTARIVGLGLRMGIRLAAVPFLQQQLLGLVEGVSGESEKPGSKSRAAQSSK